MKISPCSRMARYSQNIERSRICCRASDKARAYLHVLREELAQPLGLRRAEDLRGRAFFLDRARDAGTSRGRRPRARSPSRASPRSSSCRRAASSRITASTSSVSSGSSEDVASSNSITFGRIASARAIATRCCCPPESRAGIFVALSSRPTRRRQASPTRRFLARHLAHADRRLDHVAEHRHVRPQVELLEHDTELAAHRVDLGERARPASAARIACAMHSDSPSMKISPEFGTSR